MLSSFTDWSYPSFGYLGIGILIGYSHIIDKSADFRFRI